MRTHTTFSSVSTVLLLLVPACLAYPITPEARAAAPNPAPNPNPNADPAVPEPILRDLQHSNLYSRSPEYFDDVPPLAMREELEVRAPSAGVGGGGRVTSRSRGREYWGDVPRA